MRRREYENLMASRRHHHVIRETIWRIVIALGIVAVSMLAFMVIFWLGAQV